MKSFRVFRRCVTGFCLVTAAGGPCACPDPYVDVDVDELTALELAHFGTAGSEEQRVEIQGWLYPDEAALLAGQPDRFPELVPS